MNAIKDKANISEVIDASKITPMFGDATKDSRVPDIIVQPINGVIYTKTSATKIAEHGGMGEDDTHVALLLSNPGLAATEVKDAVTNMQVAPTILAALGLDPTSLQAVKAEGTKVLPVAGLTK